MKNKALALLLGVLGVVVLVGGVYYALTYFSYLGNLIIAFFSANSVQDLSSCGLYIPEGFNGLRDQIATTILPLLYLGVPLFLILVSVLMFCSGYYFGRHSTESQHKERVKREEEIKQEVAKRMGRKQMKATEEEEPEEEEEEPEEKKPKAVKKA